MRRRTRTRGKRSHPATQTLPTKTSLKTAAGKYRCRCCRREAAWCLCAVCGNLLDVSPFPPSAEQKAVGKIIKFGTNIDLSDPKR